MDRGLQHFLDALERRWRFTLWLDLYLETAFVTSVLLAAALLAGRLALGAPAAIAQGPALAAVINGIVLGGSAFAATALVWIAGRRRALIATEADRALRLEARLLTADEVLHGAAASPLESLLLSDASRRIEGRRPSEVFPLPPVAYRWATLLALAAITMAVLAPPSLSWSGLRKNPLTLFGSSPKPEDGPAVTDGVAPPEADFQAFPLKGKAPLDVRFEDRSRGDIDSRAWNFGDIGGAGSKYPRHTFRKPGKYTITLEVAGPGGRDVERKVEYIEVEPGDGGGGGNDRDITGLATPYHPTFSDDPRQGAPPNRPEIQKVPVGVDPISRESGVVKKTKYVFEPGPAGDATAPPPSFEQVFPTYRRVAEEAVGREHVPSGLRDYVRAYFERIAPK